MSRRSRVSLLAWAACAAAIVLTLGGVALLFFNSVRFANSGLPFLGLSSAVVGGLVASRRPSNPVGWIFLASALLGALRELVGEYAIYGIRTSPDSVPFAEAAAWLSAELRVLGPTLGFVVLPLLFPDGRLLSRRWNVLLWVTVATVALMMVVDAFMPQEAVYATGIQNPLDVEALRPFRGAYQVATIIWFITLIFAAAASLVVRFRRSSGVERQQIKWLTYAAAVIPVWFVVNGPVQQTFPNLFSIVDSLVIAGVPLAAGVAILRHRLYDIDLLINRTLVYGSLTLSLVAVYFAGVIVSGYFFRALTGGNSQLSVVVSTLIIAALFSPLRRRIQSLIDRRFYRRKYDAAKTLEAFSARLRDETDLDGLGEDLLAVIRKTVQPSNVSLWLSKPPDRRSGERG